MLFSKHCRTLLKQMMAAFCFIFLSINFSHAEFVGNLKLLPDGCQNGTYCKLGENFGYIDKNGLGWQADKNDKTDGASIPKWAQRFIGVPFTKEYLKAAVLHDHYSKSVRPVRGWLETQRMFHEVLLFSGVSKTRAAIMYAGVLIGSGKWIVRMEGKPCDTGQICLNNIATVNIQKEPESFNNPEYFTSFDKIKKTIEQSTDLSNEQIEALALQERPNDIYLKNKSGIILDDTTKWPFPLQVK